MQQWESQSEGVLKLDCVDSDDHLIKTGADGVLDDWMVDFVRQNAGFR